MQIQLKKMNNLAQTQEALPSLIFQNLDLYYLSLYIVTTLLLVHVIS